MIISGQTAGIASNRRPWIKFPKGGFTMVSKILARIGWLIAGAAALILSASSLYFAGLRYGVPTPLAAIIGLSFDGEPMVSAPFSAHTAESRPAPGDGRAGCR